MKHAFQLLVASAFLVSAGVRCDSASLSRESTQEEVGSTRQAVLVATPEPKAVGNGVKVAVGKTVTCAVVGNNSALKCWGSSADGVVRGDQPGEMGDALPLVNLAPYEVPKINEVAIGGSTICVTRAGADGNYALQCWGNNSNGQLGLGDTQTRTAPVPVPAVPLAGYRVAVGGFHVCRMPGNDMDGPDGSVYCLGSNAYGQLGSGTYPDLGDQTSELGPAELPVNLGSGRRAKSIALGQYHTCALLDDNQVKCWGINNKGQLGLGDTRARGKSPSDMGDNLPTVPLGTGRYAKEISVGYYISCALLDNDVTKCWGQGSYLGTGTTANFGDEPWGTG